LFISNDDHNEVRITNSKINNNSNYGPFHFQKGKYELNNVEIMNNVGIYGGNIKFLY
jgi:hypothetical protein